MSDKPLESGQNEGTGLPSPKFQSDGDKQASTGAGVQVVPLDQLEQVVSRLMQGQKDRRINKMERQLDAVNETLERYEQLRSTGMTPDEAAFRLKVEEVVERGKPQSVSTSPANPGTITQEEAVRQAQALLKETGLENDPELTTLFTSKTFKNGDELVGEVVKFTARRLKAAPAPNPATTISPAGGSAPTEDLQALYNQEITKIRRGDVMAVSELQRKFREKGLNI
jgi:hypothetical protein